MIANFINEPVTDKPKLPDTRVCWRDLIIRALRSGDKIEDLTIAIDDGELNRKFDKNGEFPNGAAFTAWSHYWVYFPVASNGEEWVESVPRNICSIITPHIGG